MIKNIIFDFGGVLVDWDPRHFYRTVFEDENEMEEFLGTVCTSEWNVEQDRGRTLIEATELKIKEFPEKEELIRMYYDQWHLMFNGVIQKNVDLIRPFKEEFEVYGLTNWSADTYPTALELFPFLLEFEGRVVVSGRVKLIKPDPAIFELLLNQFTLKADESIFIDDNAANIATAKSLGFKTVHCLPETDVKAEIDQMIADLN